MHILVTGGAGFIGSTFLLMMVPRHTDITFVNIDKLTYAANLHNLAAIADAPNYRFVRGDIANRQRCRRGISAVSRSTG